LHKCCRKGCAGGATLLFLEAGSYDAALVDAVKHFQLRHGLDANGSVGPQALRALNVPVALRIKPRSFARTSARHGFRLCRDPVKAVSYECQKCRRTLGAPRPRRHRIVLPFPGSTYPARVQKLLAIVEFAARSIPAFRAKANQRAAACIGPSTQLEPGPLFDPCLEEQKPRCIRN
jgi:peptidoglycan hydrolase-like protein with peptidoglycan-binding domain